MHRFQPSQAPDTPQAWYLSFLLRYNDFKLNASKSYFPLTPTRRRITLDGGCISSSYLHNQKSCRMITLCWSCCSILFSRVGLSIPYQVVSACPLICSIRVNFTVPQPSYLGIFLRHSSMSFPHQFSTFPCHLLRRYHRSPASLSLIQYVHLAVCRRVYPRLHLQCPL